jgi:predicted MPP superfamily phosphohydrolase
VIRRVAGALAAAGLGWGLFEAQWVRFRRVEIPIAGLPSALDGFRILQLTDLHLGTLSQNGRTLRKAIEWEEARDVDLLALTGDLVSRRRGESQLEAALGRLEPRFGTFAVLGNHELGERRDPFSQPVDLNDVALGGTVLLADAASSFEVGRERVQVVGARPGSRRFPPLALVDESASLRILLAHFPDTIDAVPPGAFHLVLAGHMHGGQICVPRPGGKTRLLNVFDPYLEGLYTVNGTPMYVSPGLGTTLVPVRYFARPEASLLVLRAAPPSL